VYEVPSGASGDAGLEGFSVEGDEGRLGRVAAVNATPEGPVLLVDTGDAYRVVPCDAVARVELLREAVLLTPEAALLRAPGVQPRVQPAGSPVLVRAIPRELDARTVEGEPRARRESALWWIGGLLVGFGALGVFAGSLATVEGLGGPRLRWIWSALPLVVVLFGGAALWAALGHDSPRPLSGREKAADALTLLFGVSRDTRRRG
jgi:hypothetical protein